MIQLLVDTAAAMTTSMQNGYEAGKTEGERISKAKIARLEAALEECLEYFEERYDVVDGDYGIPAANKEMQMGFMIETALGRRP